MPSIKDLLYEANLELDDVRWYLCQELAKELLAYQNKTLDLTVELWSGRLEDRLYNMEERFVAELEQKASDGQADEGWIRSLIAEMRSARQRRPRQY